MAKKFEKYLYYENSVQTPEEHVKIFDQMFLDLRGKIAMSLKEDFCGTFMISCEWVKSHPKRNSVGVDLDPEPLAYGKKNAFRKLTSEEKSRVTLFKQDVCKPLKNKVDVIGAGNFSFYIFKEREQLRNYFKAALKSLNRDGIFVLEMAGGPGFIIKGREQHTYRVPEIGKYTYYWDQVSYDPVKHHGLYAIHFKDSKGEFHKNVFTYDWRVWTIPEVREIMIEAGFKDTAVYWEPVGRHKEGTGSFVRMESGDNAYAWIAFVVGIR